MSALHNYKLSVNKSKVIFYKSLDGCAFMYKCQHELHLWIYYMSKFLNTSEFIIMINSRQILNLS
jgi:hypothetical protein